jgi:hypothetical protein
MSEETSNSSTGMGSSDSTAAKPAKRGVSRGILIGGLVAIVVIAGVVVSTNNSDAPRSGTASCATTSVDCEIGAIGPGGGKVFSLGGATSPADCSGTEVVCLEVATLAWQEARTISTSTDKLSSWSDATTAVAGFATTTAAAGQWSLPTLSELTTLANLSATDQAKVNGFRDVTSAYWTSTEGYGQLADRASVGSAQNPNIGTKKKTLSYYSRPIHAF